jgi:hypothetical protein
MKNLDFLTGFLLASCLFLLVSANSKQTNTEQVSRYHVSFSDGFGSIVYDAVTGKKKRVAMKDLKDETITLKQHLEN